MSGADKATARLAGAIGHLAQPIPPTCLLRLRCLRRFWHDHAIVEPRGKWVAAECYKSVTRKRGYSPDLKSPRVAILRNY
jgi:hypothetical protein